MNLNYVGSVAERFMKFRSTISSTESATTNIFNALSIYVPKSLAAAQFATGSYDPTEVTATKYAVITVTVDNYSNVLADGSVLLSKWKPVFNDGTNTSIIIYCIVFDDTGFAPTVTAEAVTWAPLTKAFKDLYFISFFKTMFSEHYDGTKSEDGAAVTFDDSNYFDMCLALSYQCENETTLSYCLIEAAVTVFEDGDTDTNKCKVMSHTRGEETAHCTTMVGSTTADRAEYFWGYLNLMGGAHTFFIINNNAFMLPIILGKWFEEKNSSGEFIGNKLAKIRLSGTTVKPTGLPSPLNSDINLNLSESIYTKLDDKYVGYFISIADGSDNNVELIRDRGINNYPITAFMIAKNVDYNASQAIANYLTDIGTLTNPVLCNEKTYSNIQTILQNYINTHTTTGRITNVRMKFPPFAEAKVGNGFEGTAVWSAVYIDDFDHITVSGSISF